MLDYPVQHYFPALTKLVGHDLHQTFGVVVLLMSILVSGAVMHTILNALSEKPRGILGSFLFMAGIIFLSPLFIMMADLSVDVYFDNVSASTRQYLGLLIASILVGAWPMTRLYKCSILTSVLSVLPSVTLWVMLIFTVRFMEEQIDSSEVNTQKIRGRTSELDNLINQ